MRPGALAAWDADVAQLVERVLGKYKASSSILDVGSSIDIRE